MRIMRAMLVFTTSVSAMAACSAHAATQELQQDAPAEDIDDMPADVQEVPSAPALDEIVVTANKRAESTQDVPIAISAFNQELLNEKGANDLVAITTQVPSLTLNATQGVVRISLRGAGNDSVSTGSDNGVAFHYDGIYFGSAASSLSDIWDVERVEVLRGPQGTLFGRNTTGGSINVIPERPKDYFEAKGDVSYGNYNYLRFRGALNLPVADGLNTRFSFTKTDRDGFTKNTFPGRADIDDADSYSLRAQVSADISADANVRFSFITSKNDDKSNQGVRIGDTYDASGPFAPFFAQAFAAAQPKNTDPRVTRQNFDSLSRTKLIGGAIDFEWDLGSVIFRSVTGYFNTDRNVNSDWDDSETDAIHLFTGDDSDQFTQEIQLLSDYTSRFQWIIGATYFDFSNKNEVFLPIGEVANRPGPFFGKQIFQSVNSQIDVLSYAIFGQGSYDLTDKLTLTLGGRYSWDEKESTTAFHPPINPSTMAGAPPTVPPPDFLLNFGARFDNSEPTGTAKLAYDITDDQNVYASYSRGYRAGALNPSDPVNPIAGSENVDSYEIGSKSLLFGRRVELNLAAYYAKYTNIQINTFPSVNAVLVNIPGGDIYGLEADFKVLVAENFRIDGSLGLINSSYDDFVTGNPGKPNPAAMGAPTQENIGGNRFINTPDVSFAIGGIYTVPTDIGDFSLRGDFAYRSKINYEVQNNADTTQDSYTKTDLRLSYKHISERWGVDVWVQNLEDEDVALTLLRPGAALGAQVPIGYFAPPRTYGVTLRANY
ncbi:TonB-dependent receptor [Novosphingopyxis sp.]|uniref:TonB-dependent receptor n=1 Tax=Novosphingopyxis sp. TaxID=2709690 RepID=UPI003B5BC6B0